MSFLPKNIYTAQQIRDIEKLCDSQLNLSATTLMLRAGKAAFDYLCQRWPAAKHIHVVCGPGNNGGDGYCVAMEAKQAGFKVVVWQVGDHSTLKEAARNAYQRCREQQITLLPLQPDTVLQGDIIVDALFGSGLNKPVTGIYADAIAAINHANLPVLAIDIPSGLHADTGNVLQNAVEATATITFLALKLGLLTGHGRAYCGELIYDNLAIPESVLLALPPIAQRLSDDIISEYILPRRQDAHKGNFGHVLVIGGDVGMPGAVRMAGESALRVGAGLVTIATRPEHVTAVVSQRPELMCHGIGKPEELEPLLARASVLIVGPGLGRSIWSQELFACAMQSTLPTIVDADGLFWLSQFEITKNNWILTPHPGEAARLLQTTSDRVQQHRLGALAMLQMQYGGVTVLKGSGTLVLGNERIPALCSDGNPGMATGGMGDVLSGIIGGIVAQGIALETAAKIAVLVHAQAADHAKSDHGERGLLATDLLPYVRLLINPS